MFRPTTLAPIALLIVFPWSAAVVSAQYGPTTSETLPNNYPPPLPQRRGPAPKLSFLSAGEVTLPGPLEARTAWIDGGQVLVPVAGGIARVDAKAGAEPEIVDAAPPAEPEDGWLTAPDGQRRYRTTPEGIVEAQKRTSRRKRWVRVWKIVAPNSTLAPPLLIGPRLCYAGLDDRLTCVRASNGHRLWSVDLGDRISRPIASWPASLGSADRKTARGDRSVEGDVLLVVPDNGASVVALDAYDGTRIASYELPAAQNRFASAPFVLPGGRIVVVRKGYAADEAALTLLDLVAAPAEGRDAPLPYNADAPKPK